MTSLVGLPYEQCFQIKGGVYRRDLSLGELEGRKKKIEFVEALSHFCPGDWTEAEAWKVIRYIPRDIQKSDRQHQLGCVCTQRIQQAGEIQNRNGKIFQVGLDCVEKFVDPALYKELINMKKAYEKQIKQDKKKEEDRLKAMEVEEARLKARAIEEHIRKAQYAIRMAERYKGMYHAVITELRTRHMLAEMALRNFCEDCGNNIAGARTKYPKMDIRTCYTCKMKGKCMVCRKAIDPKYPKCYTCNLKK